MTPADLLMRVLAQQRARSCQRWTMCRCAICEMDRDERARAAEVERQHVRLLRGVPEWWR